MKKKLKVEILKDFTNIGAIPFPSIEIMGDIRYLFGSKEWIDSFTSSFSSNHPVIVKLSDTEFKDPIYLGLQTTKEDSNTLEPIGTPYNDCNFLSIYGNNVETIIIEGLNELKLMGYKINIDLLFNQKEVECVNKLLELNDKKIEIKESQTPYVLGLYSLKATNQANVVDKKFSNKLLTRIKKNIAIEKFNLQTIEGTYPNFNKSLKRLLRHRKENFFLHNNEDAIGAFSVHFEKFMMTLIDIDSIKKRCCIFELFLGKKYIASRLYFYENSYFLNYLASYNRNFAKLSPGLISIYLIEKYLVQKYKLVTIDYSRGNEPYKYKIGGKNLILHQIN